MKILGTIFGMLLCLPAAIGQTTPAQIFEPMRNSRDPFAELHNRAIALDRDAAISLSQAEMDLAQSAPCDSRIEKSIQQAEDAQIQALAARAAYWQKWLEYAQTQSSLFERLIESRKSTMAETQADLDTAQKDLADVQSRQEQLPTGVESDAARRTLTSLQVNAQSQIRNLQRGIKIWGEAQNYSTNARERAAVFIELTRRQQDSLRGATLLWQAYFESRRARRQLNCIEHIEPQNFPDRLPPE